jgi:hypothetical protein
LPASTCRMRQPSRCTWPPPGVSDSAERGQPGHRAPGSVAHGRTPAAPLATVADGLAVGVAPAAPAGPAALPRTGITARSVIRRPVVTWAGIRAGDAQAEQSTGGNAYRNAAAASRFSRPARRRFQAEQDGQSQERTPDYSRHGEGFPSLAIRFCTRPDMLPDQPSCGQVREYAASAKHVRVPRLIPMAICDGTLTSAGRASTSDTAGPSNPRTDRRKPVRSSPRYRGEPR